MAVKHHTGLPPELAQAPLRTVRARDVQVYAHPRQQLARLERNGLMHRLADGFFVVVPQDRVGGSWMPTLEGAAAGIAAAEFGAGHYALMGMTAARAQRAVPRAIARAYVAAPRRRAAVALTDRQAAIQFLARDVERMQLEMLQTDLGACLATTPEQTVLDIAHLHAADEMAGEASAAIRRLLRRCDPTTMEKIAGEQRLQRALARVKKLSGGK